MSTLDRAIRIAAVAQMRRTDQPGEPYSLHLLRVMFAFSPPARIAAVLHDVLEDTNYTLHLLEMDGFSQPDLDAVVALTRAEGESYPDFVLRAARDPIGREVKIADIRDNLRLERLARLPDPELRRLERKYTQALQLLGVSR